MKREYFVQQIEAMGKDFFSVKDLKRLFPGEAQLNISVKRLIDAGIIINITRGIYALKRTSLDIEKVATRLYYPSYISFESALSKYGVINQGLYGLTLATTRHSKRIELAGLECRYSQLGPSLFFGFDLVNGTYLAQPEKAFLDQIYLTAFGKRTGSVTEWDTSFLNRDKVSDYAKFYNRSVQKRAAEMGF